MRRKDDFPAKVIERLRSRVAHRCSKPDCRVSTAGPGQDELAVAHVGKAAHITAASVGGPRYDETMSSIERRSIKNAIWLCSIHADEIDANEELYPATLLHEWKRLAEAAAHAEKGKRLPHPDDARNELTQALTGLPAWFTHTAISNVHEASTQRLNSLDPRLVVETAYVKGKTIFNILPKETIPFKLLVPAAPAEEWKEGLENLIYHGKDAKLTATGIRMTGSPLFEQLHSGPEFIAQHISLKTHKKNAVLKLKLLDPATNQVEQFDDCHGTVSLGQKSLRFEGSLCQGLLSLSFNANIFDISDDGDCALTDDFDKWAGTDIRRLPFFEKISRFFELLASGWKLDFYLELDGLSVLDGSANITSAIDYFSWANRFLGYVALASRASRHLGIAIVFDPVTEISRDDYEALEEVVDTFEGRRTCDRSSLTENPTCHLVAENNLSNIRRLVAAGTSGSSMTLQAHEGDLIRIFGHELRLPRRGLRMDGVSPNIQQDIGTIKDGDSVLVEWVPTDEFRLSYRFMGKDDGPPNDLAETGYP